MKKIKAILLIFFIAISFLTVVDVSLAKFTADDSDNFLDTTAEESGVKGAPGVEITVEPLLVKVVKMVFIIVGIMFFIIVVVSGIQWLVSQGEEEQIKKAQKGITGAVIGLLIIVGAYALTSFISQTVIADDRTPFEGGLQDDNVAGKTLGCCIQSIQTITALTQLGWDSSSPDNWSYCMTTEAGCNTEKSCLKGDYKVLSAEYDADIKNSDGCQKAVPKN